MLNIDGNELFWVAASGITSSTFWEVVFGARKLNAD
jgi:hypothetical protein